MTFEVGVKLQTGERFEIEADCDETVADLKNRIEGHKFEVEHLCIGRTPILSHWYSLDRSNN